DSARQENSIDLLSTLAERGQVFPDSIFLILSNLLNSNNESTIKILVNIAKNEQSLSEKATSALIDVLKKPKVDKNVKSIAAEALGEIAKSGSPLPKQAISALISVLEKPEGNKDIKSAAA